MGYEVWAGNNRGTKYSCKHTTLSNTSDEYWNFSFQEMAEKDVPAFYKQINLISQVDKITLISHSQGATQSFAALSTNKSIDDQTENFIALAPVLYVNRFLEHPNFLTLLVKFNVIKMFDLLKIKSVLFIDPGQNKWMNYIFTLFCKKTSFVCKLFFEYTIDKSADYLNLDQMPYYLSYCPSGTSVKCLKHFIQFFLRDKPSFTKYDYGKQENVKVYGSEDPPTYDISKINTKVSLFYGENDTLCSLQNVAYLTDIKKNIKSYYMDQWGHIDYTWGKDKSKFFLKLQEALN